MRAIVRDPAAPSGAALVRRPDPGAPGPGEVRVRMRLAPINPADRLVLSGRYAPVGGLPEIVGAEGMGIVDAVGPDVTGFAVGRRVILLSRGNWAEWRLVPAAEVLPVPDDLPDAQAAILRINRPRPRACSTGWTCARARRSSRMRRAHRSRAGSAASPRGAGSR